MKVIIEKFHVIFYANKKIEEERLFIRSEDKIKIDKYLLLKNRNKLTKEEREKLKKILEKHPRLRFFYVTRLRLQNMYKNKDRREADMILMSLIRVLKNTSDGELITFGSTLSYFRSYIRYSIRFSIDPKKIQWVAENLGKEEQIVERVVKADSRSVVRNIAREFTAEELYTGNVFKFQERVENILKENFEKNGLILDEFLTRQIKFSPEYVSAVEQKQIEKEKIKTEEYKAEQEEYRKKQKIIRAEGEAQAQDILRKTIDPLVLQKMAIEKWDGKLPIYMGDDAVPFLDIK